MPQTVMDQLRLGIAAALNSVMDPCSVGRGVSAGLGDMGLVCGVDLTQRPDGRYDVRVTLRLTSPGCTFQMYFDQQVKARLRDLSHVAAVEVVWATEFDWSDDDLSDALKERLRTKRELALIDRRSAEGGSRAGATAGSSSS